MSSLNRVTLIGYLGGDPESRAFPDGSAVCNLRLAPNRPVTKFKGKKIVDTTAKT
jgi:single-stranded DNA-binding protein